MSPNPFTWRWQFFLLAESTRHLLSAYVGVDFSFVMSLCFFVNRGVPRDEDLEWLFIRKKLHCYNESVGSNNMFWSNYFFYICFHAGGFTKHFRWPEVKLRDEESSPSDALTSKKQKTRLTGKARTYLWACPLPPPPPPQPHLPFPCFFKIKVRGSSKLAWIDAVRTTRYSLILMLCCDVFTFAVKQVVPSDEDLEWLYLSCLLYEKSFLELFARLQTRDISDMLPNPFTWRWQFFLLAEKNKHKISSVRVCGRGFFV